MARIRTIKPEFFKNELLADLPALVRLLFIGLWTQADREGRLLDRPRRLKAEIFPYDEIDVDKALAMLSDLGFIQRYSYLINDTNLAVIQIVNFLKHQNPHLKEQPSELQSPCEHHTSTIQAQYNNDTCMVLAGQEGKGKEGKGKGAEKTRAREENLFSEKKLDENKIHNWTDTVKSLTDKNWISQVCTSQNFDEKKFQDFILAWLERKKLAGAVNYQLQSLKKWVIEDFEKQKFNDNGSNKKVKRGLTGAVPQTSNGFGNW